MSASSNSRHGVVSPRLKGPEHSRSQATYERIAPLYDLASTLWEASWKKTVRPLVFEGLSGRILDAGIGTGLSIPYYPRNCSVIGIDLSDRMLKRAQRRAQALDRDVALSEMDLLKTTFPDRYFDYVTASFVLCTLSDADRLSALREFSRICRTNGEIRVLDYCLSRHPPMRLAMRCFEPWLRWAFNGTFNTRIEKYVEPAGLKLTESRHLVGDFVKLTVLRPDLERTASKPREPELEVATAP